MKKFYRSEENRKIFGICGGLGELFDVDPNVFRLGVILLTLATGCGGDTEEAIPPMGTEAMVPAETPVATPRDSITTEEPASQDVGNQERRAVGIRLAAGAELVRNHPVADETQHARQQRARCKQYGRGGEAGRAPPRFSQRIAQIHPPHQYAQARDVTLQSGVIARSRTPSKRAHDTLRSEFHDCPERY